MNKIFDDVVRSITRVGNAKIISTSNNKYFIKEKSKFLNKSIFDYLDSRNFRSFIPIIGEIDNNNVYDFKDDKSININDKALDLINTMSMLHNKTTIYQDVVLDDIKKLYEEQLELINYLRMYYEDLQDYIESKIYMAPGEYLLMRHISEIYLALDYSYKMLEDWYLEKNSKKNERVVQLHNNISIEHFICNDNNYLISWDKSSKGNVIYDFISFYKNDYLKLEMHSLYKIYQSKYRFDSCEEKLFFSILSIPWKIEFGKNNLANSIKCLNLVRYVIKTREFLLNENKKYKETDE